jgi:hypothetical protein
MHDSLPIGRAAIIPGARLFLPCLALVAAVGCGGDGPTEPAKPTPNFVRVQSDVGDWVGAGRTYEYTQANAILRMQAFDHLSLRIEGDQTWQMDAIIPGGVPLRPGTYANLPRYGFSALPSLAWSGDGRGCSSSTGTLTIDSVTYTCGALSAIDFRVEQHCENATPALRATIHWRADDPTVPPGPTTPVPSTLWRPAPGSTPASGNYVALFSDAGDWIGQGFNETFTAPIVVSSNGSRLTIQAGGYTGEFQAMLGTSPVAAGYYPDLRRYPFHNPTKGGLDWSGNGRGCNTLTGWFAVDRIVYTGTTISALDLRFEQHCEGGAPALRGAIHWN